MGYSHLQKLGFGMVLALLTFNTLVAQDIDELKVEVLAKTTQSWNQDTLPAYGEGQPEVTILRIIIPAGMQLPLHKHPVINAGVLLKGELTVITEGKDKLYMKAGDSIVELVNKWHYGKNEGKEAAEIIVFYAGNKDKAITLTH
ncbi:MAG: cupin domain-containing protein [Marinomonas sp.]|jgi:quercetin dioxygenase-like cupin family protein|uniref:cupin domain-containing protein n=2 Tax=Marinomonas TaxID=28253 RepID=UPI000B07C177|nr:MULTISPECIES: cupin domain-containing protein [unclassified Marinomonas]